LLTVVRTAPVSVLVAVTVTPGSAAPESSVTEPEIEPVELCANAPSETRRRAKRHRRIRADLLRVLGLPDG
jgi:hypothetical protein